MSSLSVFWACNLDLSQHVWCSLYESICPLDSAVVEQLRTPLEPLLEVEGLNFNRCDAQHGAWRNYFMGVVGSIAAAEEDVLWPNQASLHRT